MDWRLRLSDGRVSFSILEVVNISKRRVSQKGTIQYVAMVVFELDNSDGLNVEEGFGRTLLRVALDTGVGGDSVVQIVVTYSVLVVVLVHQEQCPLLTRYKIGGEIRSFCFSHGCVAETEAK